MTGSAYRWDISAHICARKVVGIVRAPDRETSASSARRLLASGLDVVEITLTARGALDAIADVVRAEPDALVGAGTVLDAGSAEAAIRAGARFIVSPVLDHDVVRTAHRLGVACLPGASTPTELVRCLEAGADLVKAFPAASLGPAWLTQVRAALPQAPVVATGGLTPDTVEPWFAAGAVAVGLGSALAAGTPEQARDAVTALLLRLSRLP